MKKIYLLFLLLICFVFASCQNKKIGSHKIPCGFQNDDVADLGIGLAVWNYDCETNLVIFNDTLMKKKVYDINICVNNFNYPCPFFYKSDYGIYHFIVTKSSEKWNEIIYNGNEKGYILTNSAFKFVDWNIFLTEYLTGLKEKGKETNCIIKSINGDTIFVEEEKNHKKKYIRWKDNNKLLIDMFLLE